MKSKYDKNYRYLIILNIVVIIAVLSIVGISNKANKLEQREAEAHKIIQDSSQKDKPQVLAESLKITSGQIQTARSIKYIGEFKVTAYCPCEKCCGHWAQNRPKDKDGNEIVYTASGAVATPGQTVAVDIKHIPYGTRLIIDGHEYIASDTGSAVKGKAIDIMFSTHAEAEAWGKQTHIIYEIIEEE